MWLRFRPGQEDGIEERSFVASLLWMTAQNGLGGGTKGLGEAEALVGSVVIRKNGQSQLLVGGFGPAGVGVDVGESVGVDVIFLGGGRAVGCGAF